MDDKRIIDLYWARDEEAIRETSLKYGRLCTYIAKNILASREDCEECVNDTYLAVWNAIPVQRPGRFSAFVSKITRNLALKKYEYVTAAKLAGGLGQRVWCGGKAGRLLQYLQQGDPQSMYGVG